jgi:hypothetical protein
MTFKQWSLGDNANQLRMFLADAHRLRCVRGTILGRDVVPEVCNTGAWSSGRGAAILALGEENLRAAVWGDGAVSRADATICSPRTLAVE